MRMSKSGTPFRGIHPVGWGGTYGKYPNAAPVMNSLVVNTRGTEYMYIKPSNVSAREQVNRRFPWIRHGQYPDYWVQPNYTGNLSGTTTQQAYIEKKASDAVRALDVNDTARYITAIVPCGPTLTRAGRSTAGFTYDNMARNGPYAKTLGQPVNYGEYLARRKRQCLNPVGAQKPFPFATNVGKGMSVAGSRVESFGNSCPYGPVYLTPPAWYVEV
jgi:hypothetical protein